MESEEKRIGDDGEQETGFEAKTRPMSAFKPTKEEQRFIDDLVFTNRARKANKQSKKVVVSKAFIRRLKQGIEQHIKPAPSLQ